MGGSSPGHRSADNSISVPLTMRERRSLVSALCGDTLVTSTFEGEKREDVGWTLSTDRRCRELWLMKIGDRVLLLARRNG